MEGTNTSYDILWSIVAIVVGFICIFFRKQLLKQVFASNLKMYKQTGLSYFKYKANEAKGTYGSLFVIIAGIVSIIIGISTFLKNV